jgi:Uma2 family endonuclease
MPTKVTHGELKARYEKAAELYARRLPLEHYMEPTSQATQREITLESLALVRARRPDIQVFNELLVQYPRPGKKRPGQVVPDNMVVVHSRPIKNIRSYNVPLQPAAPFWMLEYVSKGTTRKDYVDNMYKYEHELKVPYYLLFDPEKQVLNLYRHSGQAFAPVEADEQGRLALPQLDLSVAILDRWVRFWYQGELLPLPAELQKSLDEIRARLERMQTQLSETQQQLAEAKKEIERLRRQSNVVDE